MGFADVMCLCIDLGGGEAYMFSDRPGGLRIDRWLYWRRMTG